MNMPDRDGIYEHAKHALQLLACPAETQIRLLPLFVCVTDELALDFDHWKRTLVGNFASEMTAEQIASLTRIDEHFAFLSRGGEGFQVEFWTPNALRESVEWQRIREMAVQALQLFGWPVESPPSYAHEYIGGGPSPER